MSDYDEDEVPTKFEDAEDAGTENGFRCTLILADGWNAAAISVAGLSVLSRRQYGMFRLEDFTQVARNKKIEDNPEIIHLMEILGLKYNLDYASESQRKTLLYGRLMLLTDQNVEGTYFKGLFIYFIYTNWPHLLRMSFVEEFITPIVRATNGVTKYSFFSLTDFEKWKLDKPDSAAFNFKYYIGLGTNSRIEAKEYFSNVDFHRVTFKYNGIDDDQSLIKAFGENAIEQRREWLSRHMEKCKSYGLQSATLYTGKPTEVTISKFIDFEYVFYANFDNFSSIPNVVDGFKPGQRKILFTCLKRDDKSEINVARLACSVAEEAAYYQGELGICKDIYNLAQSYVGSNNINLLIPFGQFGTRLMGGEDCADHHHTFTMLSTVTRSIFRSEDDPLLSHNTSDHEKQKIEPKWYVPIIPMILVNGSKGAGTGWSTNIPKHNPHQLIRCLRQMIAGTGPKVLTPYYKNFRGTIQSIGDGHFITIGCLAIIEDNKIEITELPVGTWTMSYKENVLLPLLTGSETMDAIIADFKEYHTDTTVRFVVSLSPGQCDRLQNEVGGLHRIFQLYTIIRTDNMYAFDGNNSLRRYASANDILKEFCDLRLEYYVKRRKYLERKLTAEADKLINQARFITERTSNRFVMENKPLPTIVAELIRLGYEADPVEHWKQENGIESIDADRDEFQFLSEDEKNDLKKFDYLLNMPMWMLSEELTNQLIRKRDDKLSELNALKRRSEYDLWLSDLDELENELSGNDAKDKNDLLFNADDGRDVELKMTNEFVEHLIKHCDI